MGQTILDYLEKNAAERGKDPALGWFEKSEIHWQTWEDIQQDVDVWSAEMWRRAEPDGFKRVVLHGDWSYSWVTSYLSILRAGLAVIPANSSISHDLAEAFAEEFDAGLFSFTKGGLLAGLAPFLQPSRETLDLTPVQPDSIACIQPTSGTSGAPRGVMLTHQNLLSNTIAVCNRVGGDGSEIRLSFLPFNHLYARVCDLYAWIYRGSRLVLAESRDTIFRDLQLVRPTSLNGVPYFFQKVLDQSQQQGTTIRDILGGQVKQCFSGGAALSPDLQTEFARQGVPLMSGYGLSEASPVVTASSMATNRIGTVGRPLDGVEVRIAEDGEILVSGPNVMQGYRKDPQATAEVLRDGWLHTGDLGRFDEAGHLIIEGRKKEVIVLSTGKNASPSRLEALLCASPWIEQACVVGEGRKHLAALVVPNPDRIRQEVRRRRLWVWSKRRAVSHPAIREVFAAEIESRLRDCPSEQKIRAFTLLPRGFSIERKEMTAKLSLRRGVIEKSFTREIEAMYS